MSVHMCVCVRERERECVCMCLVCNKTPLTLLAYQHNCLPSLPPSLQTHACRSCLSRAVSRRVLWSGWVLRGDHWRGEHRLLSSWQTWPGMVGLSLRLELYCIIPIPFSPYKNPFHSAGGKYTRYDIIVGGGGGGGHDVFMYKSYVKAQNRPVLMYFLHLVPHFLPLHHSRKGPIADGVLI